MQSSTDVLAYCMKKQIHCVAETFSQSHAYDAIVEMQNEISRIKISFEIIATSVSQRKFYEIS